jgi:hypothetical protein
MKSTNRKKYLMIKSKHVCLIGLLLFLVSYVLFSQGARLTYFQTPIDFAHWFNLAGAVLLLSFNKVFPKNRLHSAAAFITSLGVIAHIGLCTIDFILWSYGNDDVGKEQLSALISNTPSILYPFVIVGPSLLFIGLATHASSFIKTHLAKALLVLLGAPAIGFSFFILKNGLLMVISFALFALGLVLLLYRKEKQNGLNK